MEEAPVISGPKFIKRWPPDAWTFWEFGGTTEGWEKPGWAELYVKMRRRKKSISIQFFNRQSKRVFYLLIDTAKLKKVFGR
jgi:hypothetical protein